ncbi:hypothetical protein Bhyg_15213 [Pseudolycoriella hygida]|uniref:Uncharacterized protein n=1 Tax=Pseudolycoriella hygida TaxID=35572 RepID=A0A9Q0MUE9_9DIPT|nr:hypothetical protein Bhyg_15213 [Pseudolycoriella hygida]
MNLTKVKADVESGEVCDGDVSEFLIFHQKQPPPELVCNENTKPHKNKASAKCVSLESARRSERLLAALIKNKDEISKTNLKRKAPISSTRQKISKTNVNSSNSDSGRQTRSSKRLNKRIQSETSRVRSKPQNHRNSKDMIKSPDAACMNLTPLNTQTRDLSDVSVDRKTKTDSGEKISAEETSMLDDLNPGLSLVTCTDIQTVPSEEIRNEDKVKQSHQISKTSNEKSNVISSSLEIEEAVESDAESELSIFAPSLTDMLNSPSRQDDFKQSETDKQNVSTDLKTYRIPKIQKIDEEILKIFSQTIRPMPKMVSPIKELRFPLNGAKNNTVRNLNSRWTTVQEDITPIVKRRKTHAFAPTESKCELFTEVTRTIANTNKLPNLRQVLPRFNDGETSSRNSDDSKKRSQTQTDSTSFRNTKNNSLPQGMLVKRRNTMVIIPNHQQTDEYSASIVHSLHSLGQNNDHLDIQQTFKLFGSPCKNFLLKKPCSSVCLYQHELPNSDALLKKMATFNTNTIENIYESFINKYAVTFEQYFPAMCRISINRKLILWLVRLASDSERYKRYDFMQPLYRAFLTLNVNENDALMHILRNFNICSASEFAIKTVRRNPLSFVDVWKMYPRLINYLLLELAKSTNAAELMECINLLEQSGEKIIYINVKNLSSFASAALRAVDDNGKMKIIKILQKLST